MAQKTLGAFTEEDVHHISDNGKEPDWLRSFRLEAFMQYVSLPLERSPLYTKYTQVSSFDANQFSVGPPSDTVDFRTFFEGYLTGRETNIAVQANSATIHIDLDPSVGSKGLEIMSLSDAVKQNEATMKQLFASKLVKSRDEKYAAFNNAFFNSGTFIRVPKGVELKAPLRRLLLVREPSSSIIEQNVIISEEGSRMNFLEELYTASSSKPYLVSSVHEVYAQGGSHVDVSSIQLLDENAIYLTNRDVAVSSDAKATVAGIYLGALVTRSRLNFLLNGRGSLAEGFEVFFCNGKQRYDFETNLVHNSPNSSAATQARGVLKDESQSIFKGMIKIVNTAKNSNSYLAHHAMLMDKRARSDGIPGLEIDTNEVKATHSASVAQIDDEQIFYLMSRGLTEDEAKKMIVVGFFEPVLSRIPVEIAREGAKFMLEGKWQGEKRRLVDRETLIALTGEVPVELKQEAGEEDIFERHYKYRK